METDGMFCPICRGITYSKKPAQTLLEDNTYYTKKGERFYDKFDPPSASMIYGRSKRLERNEVTYNRRDCMTTPPGIREVEKKLDKWYYSCENCTAWSDGWCSQKSCNLNLTVD